MKSPIFVCSSQKYLSEILPQQSLNHIKGVLGTHVNTVRFKAILFIWPLASKLLKIESGSEAINNLYYSTNGRI